MLVIDGARGEGGGQVARIALALAAATRREVRVTSVRANRPEPGLKAQHLAALRALAELCDGEVEGASLGSTDVTLRPGVVVGGVHEFAVATAGSVTLVLQALLPAMAASRQEFRLRLRGGTDVRWAPTWGYFDDVHAPLLRRLGVGVSATLHRRGFFPQGGGDAEVEVATPALERVVLDEPGAPLALRGLVASHGLPRHVVERALASLHTAFPTMTLEQDFHRGPGTGISVALCAERAGSVLGADAVGRKGVRVEDVVADAVAQLEADLACGASVDVHQADQLPVFMALAGGGSYTCRHLTPHARTVLEMLPEFLPVSVRSSRDERRVRVVIERR